MHKTNNIEKTNKKQATETRSTHNKASTQRANNKTKSKQS